MQQCGLMAGVAGDVCKSVFTLKKSFKTANGVASFDRSYEAHPLSEHCNSLQKGETPTRYTLAEDTVVLIVATPQAASSQRTHCATHCA